MCFQKKIYLYFQKKVFVFVFVEDVRHKQDWQHLPWPQIPSSVLLERGPGSHSGSGSIEEFFQLTNSTNPLLKVVVAREMVRH